MPTTTTCIWLRTDMLSYCQYSTDNWFCVQEGHIQYITVMKTAGFFNQPIFQRSAWTMWGPPNISSGKSSKITQRKFIDARCSSQSTHLQTNSVKALKGKIVNYSSRQLMTHNTLPTFVVLSMLPSSTMITSYRNAWSSFCQHGRYRTVACIKLPVILNHNLHQY